MKILYHHRTLGDGAEGVHISEMVEAFERLGHQVRVNALVGSGRAAPATRHGGVVGRVRRALPQFAYELAQLALSALSAISFARAIRQFQPDLVYKRHARYDFGPVLAARRTNVPIILEVNCVYASAILRRFEPVRFPRLLNAVEGWVFRNTSRNIAVSRPLATELQNVAGVSAPVTVMPNGVNHHRFRPLADEPSAKAALGLQGKAVVGFVGTLWRWHGLDLLIEALSLVRDPNAHLLIVGDGESRQSLEVRVAERGLTGRVTFAGRVAHEEVGAYVGAMDVAVLPEDSRAHASPMKILEYMAMARPVVAPRLPSIEELMTDGVQGLLFTPGAAGELAECIDRLLAAPEERQQMGKQGRTRVERDRNWDQNARDVMILYAATDAATGRRAVSPQIS